MIMILRSFIMIKQIKNSISNSKTKSTTLSNGYLGSRNDEERSEMRYVMRIAEFSESSNL
jgi:trehalose/maltose hydrolase-like predicted phosphorylase